MMRRPHLPQLLHHGGRYAPAGDFDVLQTVLLCQQTRYLPLAAKGQPFQGARKPFPRVRPIHRNCRLELPGRELF